MGKGGRRTQPTDGLGAHEIKQIRAAMRQIWHRCKARKLAVERCTDFDGFPFCELCGARPPKIKIDHIKNVGAVDSGFIARMFVSSTGLQGLCPKCHQAKTNRERRAR